MGQGSVIKIEYFSDILCIWAYAAQRRLDQLEHDFGNKIQLKYRYCPTFANTSLRIGEKWCAKDGYMGFNKHLSKIAANWDYVTVHPQLWLEMQPASSTGAHLFLKAIQLLEDRSIISSDARAEYDNRCAHEEAAWRLRMAFFRDNRNIATREVQDSVAQEMALPLDDIQHVINSGEAFAALHEDTELTMQYKIPGSPTFVLNEGRQLLYGNVGYRIIEANIRELLRNPQYGDASWC